MKELLVSEIPPFRNLRIQVEVTTHCNVQCKMCVRPQMIKQVGARHLDWDVFVKVVEQAPPGSRFCLQGTGEPFLHPRFYDMIALCKQRGFYVETYTNGLCFEPSRVVESKLDFLVQSLLGGDGPGNDARMKGGDFSTVLTNLEALNECKRERNAERPKLGFNYCVMRDNVDEMIEVVALAARLNVVYIEFNPVGDNSELLASHSEIQRVRPAVDEAAKAAGIRIQLYDFQPGTHPRYLTCSWPWTGYYITVDGRVGPCCTRPHLASAWIPGHVNEIENMQALWESKAYQAFRRALATHRKESVPQMCKECVEYEVDE
ncbi:MAG TPA: radical SAM protein [bacterium]|nr:radical SAM protein [bacterium]